MVAEHPCFSLKSRLFLKTHQNIGKSNYNFETTFSLPFKLLFLGGIEILIIYSCTRTYPGDPDPHQWSGYVLQYTFSLLDAYHNTLHGSCPVYISTLVRNEKWELGELSVRHGVANCCWLQTVERADTCNVAAWLIHQQRSLRLTIYPDTRCLFFLRSEGGEETFTSDCEVRKNITHPFVSLPIKSLPVMVRTVPPPNEPCRG